MRSRFFLTSVCCWFLLAFAAAAFAQSGPDIFVTPIPNAPFAGVVNVERTIVQRNGAVINLRTVREIGRDSQGRIHNESRALMPVSMKQAPPVVRVHLYDPQSRMNTFLDPQQKTFWGSVVNRPPATEPPDSYASPAATGFPQNQYAAQEDLGNREIDGLTAHGVRATQTIPAESSGMGREIAITDEYWYSDELRMNLMVKHSDPRTGNVTMTVTQVKRTEPDPSFFAIPEGYKAAVPGQGTGPGQKQGTGQ